MRPATDYTPAQKSSSGRPRTRRPSGRDGDYAAAAASDQQALAQFRDLGDLAGQAAAPNELGLAQQLTGDYPGRRGQPPAGP